MSADRVRSRPHSRWCRLAAFALVATLVGGLDVYPGETVDPENDGSSFAWGENVGWLNAEPLGDGGPGMQILETRVEGWMWSENVGWINLSCRNLGGCSSVDFEVTNDGAGCLSGYGWSENAGWVSFSCENTQSCATIEYGVVVEMSTGELTGFAWSENLGWLSFSCASTGTCATADYGVRTEIPFQAGPILRDGFETGDTSRWSGRVPP